MSDEEKRESQFELNEKANRYDICCVCKHEESIFEEQTDFMCNLCKFQSDKPAGPTCPYCGFKGFKRNGDYYNCLKCGSIHPNLGKEG